MELAHPAWSPDQRSLLLPVYPEARWIPAASDRRRVVPRWSFRTFTNDTNNYSGFRLSADARSLVSIVSKVEEDGAEYGRRRCRAPYLMTSPSIRFGVSWNLAKCTHPSYK
jgi:hypothetical protein